MKPIERRLRTLEARNPALQEEKWAAQAATITGGLTAMDLSSGLSAPERDYSLDIPGIVERLRQVHRDAV